MHKGHDCRVGRLHMSSDENGALYIESHHPFDNHFGKVRVDFCPVCGFPAIDHHIEKMCKYPREDHDRNSVEQPAIIRNVILSLMHRACILMEQMHKDFDGITVRTIITGYGDTEIELKKEKRDG